jgi:hypothetical protein
MIGDKFCSRAGQKGTIGMVLDEEDMPFTAEGLRPDIIVNPHALPSRMTIGHLVEVLIGKACVFNGNIGDCTAFNNKGPKEKQFGKVLSQNGFHSTGNEIMYNGMTGEQLETEIYFGPTYYLRLKHMVKDKINYRARGPRTVLTRQTVQGRSNNGGLRVGEMDRDAILAHGMTSFIQESMMERGDKYYMAICNQTGTIAVYNESRNIFLSPLSDGPLKFTDNLDGGMNIVPVSKFGRDFSIVKVPYAFKLLYQELQAMNVQMRIITADNVDEVTSMKNSDNIIKLTGLDNLDAIVKNTSEKLVADNEQHLELKRERENNMMEEEQEKRMQQQEYGRDELAPAPPSPDLFLADNNRLPVGEKVYLLDDSQPNREWTIIEELYAGEEGKYLYIIRTSPPDQIFQLTVPSSKLQVIMPSPPVQGLAPDSPGYVPESPDYSPGTPVFDYKPPASPNQLEEDNYDYDTEDEYGFYDPGPANLEEIIKEYEESRKKMSETQDNEEGGDEGEEEEDEDEEEKKNEPERTVIEKDFNEGLNLLATEDDKEKDENEYESGDEEDGDRKSVTA